MINPKKIIVALDGMPAKEALRIANILKGEVWGFKVNDLLFDYSLIIRKLKKYGKVFADAKLHDIPNTVGNSARKLSELGADIITVHATGGIEMMKVAKQNARKSKIIAVTVLTSGKVKRRSDVLRLVKDAIKAKVDGIVCSGHELEPINELQGSKLLIKVIPGIRPKWYKTKDDQIRKITPPEAIRLGADYLVIGRPITKSKNFLKVIKNICRE
jgi:orotidine-5'-phosphate decarboxylase